MVESIKKKYLARLVRYIKDKKLRDAIIQASKERTVEAKNADLDPNDKE